MTFSILFDSLRLASFLLSLLFSFPHAFLAQNGIEIYPLSTWSDTSLITNSTQVRYSGCWGFTWLDKEYAVLGSTEGSHFFQIDNASLIPVDSVTGDYVSSQAITREFKYFEPYIFASSDEGTGSFQIIDVSYLPDSVHFIKTFRNDLLAKVHNQWVDSVNKLLYACSITPFIDPVDGNFVPMRVLDIADPLNPTLIWEGPEDVFEVHDVFVDTNGIAILNCGYEGLKVLDFSNPSSPIEVQNISVYQDQGYNHQGSFTKDRKYYIFGDETPGTKLKKAKVDTDFTLNIQNTFGLSNQPYDKTPHNIVCSKDFAYVAYYNDGLRIYDLRNDPPTEFAYYDTHQDIVGNTFSMWGAWGVYRFEGSQNILISDRISGLFLFNFDETKFPLAGNEFIQVFPNPLLASDKMTVVFPLNSNVLQYCILDSKGSILYENYSPLLYEEIDLDLSQGIYFLRMEYNNASDEKKFETKKILVLN